MFGKGACPNVVQNVVFFVLAWGRIDFQRISLLISEQGSPINSINVDSEIRGRDYCVC